MKPVLKAHEMRNIDSYTIKDVGIPGAVLMERAALSVVDEVGDLLNGFRGKKIVVFCGSGNNGGDGFAASRELLIKGSEVIIYVCTKKEKISGDARLNLDVLEKQKFKPKYIQSTDEISGDDLACDVIIDALLGTGIEGAVRGLYKEVIDIINATGVPVIAVDIASGLNCDTGAYEGACIKAERTVTMAAYKRAHVISPGREMSGRVIVADIGFPPGAFKRENIRVNLIERSDVKRLFPKRERTFHKGDAGKLFILSGSVGMTGAAALLSLASLRIGAGLAVLGIPKSLNTILEAKLTEVMTYPLPETLYKSFSQKGKKKILEMTDWADVIAIGPGISRKEETLKLIVDLLKVVEKPIVLDADGIFPFHAHKEVLKNSKADLIITPHHGELAHLIGEKIETLEKDRIGIAMQVAQELELTLLLKGSPTLIATSDGDCFISDSGNPGMASGGSGDVLTGMIGGLAAQGLNCAHAGLCAAYIHGIAGDLAARKFGEPGLIAGDILDCIPDATQMVLNS